MVFDNLFADLLGLAILLYMAFAIYMKNKNVGLKEVIEEIKEGVKK